MVAGFGRSFIHTRKIRCNYVSSRAVIPLPSGRMWSGPSGRQCRFWALSWWMPTTMSAVRPSVLSRRADEEAWMATSGWNLSIAEQNGCDFVVQCGSCYSSLRMGREHLMHDAEKLAHVNELLEPTGRSGHGDIQGAPRLRGPVSGKSAPRRSPRSSKRVSRGSTASSSTPAIPCSPARWWGLRNPPGRPRACGGWWRPWEPRWMVTAVNWTAAAAPAAS